MYSIDNLPIIFRSKNIPIPSGYRPLYKLSIILLILKFCCRGKKSSLLRIQLFSWALKSVESKDRFWEIVTEEINGSIWTLDPTIIRAINFGIGERLLERVSTSVKLTQKGIKLVKDITDNDMMIKEIDFMKQVGFQVTESKITEMSKNWNT